MRSTFYYLITFALVFSACQSAYRAPEFNKDAASYEDAADSTTFRNDISSPNSPSRKRVRTADVRCRVNNVFQAASTLEHVVMGMNGIVVESNLQHESGAMRDLPYDADSLKRVTLYTPTANLTLRVPAASLDSVVQTLTSMAAFIQYRNLKEQDKTLAYLSNSMRNEALISPVKTDSAHNTIDVANYQDNKREAQITRKIANLAILDEANYATLSVQLYQPQQADIQIVVNPDRITRAGFGTELITALRGGMDTCRDLVLFFVQIWPFLLLLAAGWFGYRKVKKLIA